MIHVTVAPNDDATICGSSRLHGDLYIFTWRELKLFIDLINNKIMNITLQCIVKAI